MFRGLRELKNPSCARNSPLSCLERICLCLLDKKARGDVELPPMKRRPRV